MGAETILLQAHQQPTWGPLVLKGAYASHHDSATDTSEWPAQVEGGLNWDGTTFTSESDYMVMLSEADVIEVKAALHHFNSSMQSSCSHQTARSC